MESDSVYTAESATEHSLVVTALRHPERERSLWGTIAGLLTWTRGVSAAVRNKADQRCSETWRAFLDEMEFSAFGGVAETFPLLPLQGRRSAFYRSPDRTVLAAVTYSGFHTTLSFWAVFSDGLIVMMSSTTGRFGIRNIAMVPHNFVRYPMSEDLRESWNYFQGALEHFGEGPRTLIPFEEEDAVVTLGREYWRRYPQLADRVRALIAPGVGLASFVWAAIFLF